MTDTSQYSKTHVTVTYTDGEVKHFTMTATHHIAKHLMENAKDIGALIMRDDDLNCTTIVPTSLIREVSLVTV